jgi:hypothetical protein
MKTGGFRRCPKVASALLYLPCMEGTAMMMNLGGMLVGSTPFGAQGVQLGVGFPLIGLLVASVVGVLWVVARTALAEVSARPVPTTRPRQTHLRPAHVSA